MMNLSRQEFLKGVLASLGFGVLESQRIFAAPLGWERPSNPNVSFGIVSDTHLRTDLSGKKLAGSDRYIMSAFRYFKEQNVDAVANCGDMADRGQTAELEFHADVWKRVFGDKGPVKLFVAGNHDLEGFRYGLGLRMRVDKIYPDPVEMSKHLLASDFASEWERIWGEKYERVWHKVIKGYHFFGRHWDVDESELVEKLKGFSPDKGKPFFLFSHQRSTKLDKTGLPFDNAVGFFGHWHCSASNWNQIYFFPGYSFPCVQVPSCSVYGKFGFGKDAYITKATIEGKESAKKGYQGYVVRVYDDFLAIERREFSKGGSLGPDWIMPLKREKGKPHPFSKQELKKGIGVPQFGENAKLEASLVNAGDESACLCVSLPLADANPNSRVYAYEVRITGNEKSKKLVKAVYASGVHMAAGHEPNGGVTKLSIPLKELPQGKVLTLAAKPMSSLGTAGRQIVTEVNL
jgi:predicted phosphodiesterase